MIAQLGRFDIVVSISGIFLLVRKNVLGEIAACGIVDGPFQTIPEREFEQCWKTRIIRSYFIVFGKNFANHVEVFRISLLFVMVVHVIIEHVQEARVFIALRIMIDVLDCVQTESVYATVNPSFGGIGYGLVSGRFTGGFHGTIVEVGKPVCPEM